MDLIGEEERNRQNGVCPYRNAIACDHASEDNKSRRQGHPISGSRTPCFSACAEWKHTRHKQTAIRRVFTVGIHGRYERNEYRSIQPPKTKRYPNPSLTGLLISIYNRNNTTPERQITQNRNSITWTNNMMIFIIQGPLEEIEANIESYALAVPFQKMRWHCYFWTSLWQSSMVPIISLLVLMVDEQYSRPGYGPYTTPPKL